MAQLLEGGGNEVAIGRGFESGENRTEHTIRKRNHLSLCAVIGLHSRRQISLKEKSIPKIFSKSESNENSLADVQMCLTLGGMAHLTF